VNLQSFIVENGDATEVGVLRGIPKKGLDEAAVRAVKNTKFTPAMQRDRSVGVWISIPVQFKLA